MLELLAKMGNVDAQVVQPCGAHRAPYLLQEILVGQHFSGVASHGGAEVMFGGCEFYLAGSDCNYSRREIDSNFTNGVRRGIGTSCPWEGVAECDSAWGGEFGDAEGLG